MANGRSQWSADFNPVEMRRPMLPGPPAPNSGFAFRVDAPEFVPKNKQPLGGHMHGVGDFRHPQMNQQHPIHVMGPGAPPMMQPQYNPQPQYGQMPGYQQPPPNNSPYYAMRMAIQPIIRTNSVQNRLNYAQQQQQQQQLHQQQIHQQQMQLAQQHPQPQIPVQLQQNPYPNMGSSGMNCNDRVASYENFDDGSGSAGVDESTNDAELHALNYLLEIVEKVNKEPGQYESVQKELTGIFIEFAQNNFVMSNAVEIVFEQSIREQNFRYMGAKICRLLDSIDPSPSSVFRNLLCYKMDYQQKELFQFMANESHKVRGTALFLAELYIQLQNDGSRLVSIAEHILGTLNLLLERKTPENVKCVCQCLKLCGYELEVDCPSETADVLASLENVTEMDNSTNKLLQSVLDLRNNRWGRSEQLAIKGEINSIGKMPVEIHDGPVFYGPDGQIMTEEENTFLLSNIKTYDKPYDDFGDEDPDELVEPDSEMTPEIQQAFKDFVKIGKK